jgi:DNA anti-recombination protein RmuC
MADIETVATGGLSGLVGTILAAIGQDRRITRVEREKLDKETFAQFERRFDDLKTNLDRLEKSIRELPDKVNEKVNGQKWDGRERRQERR